MAKLKNSFSQKSSAKLPNLAAGRLSMGGLAKPSIPKDASGQTVKLTSAGSVVQALNFGALHTKVTGSGSGSAWGGLLSAATSGGVSSVIGDGILSTGALGFIGKLLGLFGGGKAAPAVPTPFVMPASQQQTLNVGSQGAASSVSLGVQSSLNVGAQGGPVYQTGSAVTDPAIQSAQVVQIVKQALLTSSSLNDVISEI